MNFPIQVIEIVLEYIYDCNNTIRNIFLLNKNYYRYLKNELNMMFPKISPIEITLSILHNNNNLYQKVYKSYDPLLVEFFEYINSRDSGTINIMSIYKNYNKKAKNVFKTLFNMNTIDQLTYKISIPARRNIDCYENLDLKNMTIFNILYLLYTGSLSIKDSLNQIIRYTNKKEL